MKYAIIFDSFWSNNIIPFLCKQNNIIPIHVFSSAKSFNEGKNRVSNWLFEVQFIYETPKQLFDKIPKDNIVFVYGCSDASHSIVHDLSILLNKHVNLHFLKERESKYYLYKFLEQPAALTNFNEFIDQWGKSIIKPSLMKSSGGNANISIVNKYDFLESKPELFIAKYFEGDEYAIDIVSCNGKHKLVAVWKYFKNKSDPTLFRDKMELLDFNENKEFIIKMYETVSDWLGKLKYCYGPTSTELKFDGSSFYCIEINFRLHGHMAYRAWYAALNDLNQPNLTLKCYTTDFENFELQSYKNTGYISKLYYFNDKVRMFEDINWDELLEIKSIQKIWKNKSFRNKEIPIIRSNSLWDSLAIVVLYNVNKQDLNLDELKVRNILSA